MTMVNTPVIFIVFNRPEITRRALEILARVKPKKLLIIADGPRTTKPDEDIKVKLVRDAIEELVTWDCEIHKNYSTVNLGCCERIHTGLNWAFTLVDRAIILEDDCLPSDSFFEFCESNLISFGEQEEIFSISGSNFCQQPISSGYYFSDYSLMWGWATWANRWNKYQVVPDDYRKIILRKWWRRPLVALYWLSVFASLAKTVPYTTWDYQWILTVWRHDAKCIRPSRNLVINDGFGPDATHTTSNNRFYYLQTDVPASIVEKRTITSQEVSLCNLADEKMWAMIDIRTVLYLYFPKLKEVRDLLRPNVAT